MSELFLAIFNIAITAGWLVLAVLVARVLLKNAPGWAKCALWAIVGLRLIWPFELESILSLVPSAQTLPPAELYDYTPEIHTGIYAVNATINPVFTETFLSGPQNSVNPLQVVVMVASVLWIIGMVAMAGYALVSYLRLRHRVSVSMPAGEGVYLCDIISSPFILGLVKPKIYLPSNLPQEQWDAILSHERAHLARRDHWWKPLGFALLTVSWFHPLLWVAYVLLCRDVEVACDEKVIRALSPEAKKAYSQTLLECSMPRKWITACPLAFGETSVKQRIKAVLHYKKPTLWIIIATLVICSVLAVCFLTDPLDDPGQPWVATSETISNKQYVYTKPGAGSAFYINIYSDGTFQYYAGMYSSHIGLGDWELKDSKLYLYDTTLTNPMTFVFSVTEDALTYIAAESYPFMYVDVADGDFFSVYSEIPLQISAVGTYSLQYGERFDQELNISVVENGQFSYIENWASSYIGFGTWRQEKGKLYLTDLLKNDCFVFFVHEDGIVFIEEESDRFSWVELEDGIVIPRKKVDENLIFVQVTKIMEDYFLAVDAQGNTWCVYHPCKALNFDLTECWISYCGEPELDEEGHFEVRAMDCWKHVEDESLTSRENVRGWVYDYCLYDVDKDGNVEECIISMGHTSGLFTIHYSVWQDGECEEEKLLYTKFAEGFAFDADENGLAILSSEGDRIYPGLTSSGFVFMELAPAAEAKSTDEITITGKNAKFVYSITYARPVLTLEFGLIAVDGTEYVTEIIGGGRTGSIENIPAGTYYLVVRNSGNYTNLPSYQNGAESYNATGALNYSIE